jgi:hypothetical protein
MKQNKTKLIETNKVLSPLAMCENWVVLLLQARFAAQKKNISSNIGQLVTFQSILGSSIDLTSWQCSIGVMELATWQCVWLTIW